MTDAEAAAETESRFAYFRRRMGEQNAVPLMLIGANTETQALVLATGENVSLAQTREFLRRVLEQIDRAGGNR